MEGESAITMHDVHGFGKGDSSMWSFGRDAMLSKGQIDKG